MPTLLERLDESLQHLPSEHQEYEVIMVEDGSPDQSWEVLEQMTEKFSWLRTIRLMRNYGQHNALLCGIRAAKYEFIVTMDDDLQHPPKEIHTLLNAITENIDVVYGVGSTLDQNPWRNFLTYLSKQFFLWAMGVKNINDISAFRIFRAALRDGFTEYNHSYVSIDVLLSWASQKFTTVKTEHNSRYSGTSGYTLRKLIRHALNVLLGFSVVPLRVSVFLGFTLMLFGLLILSYVLVAYVLIDTVQGFTFLAASISIFSGVQLFSMGIIGEYISRIYIRSMGRPVYIINPKYPVQQYETK